MAFLGDKAPIYSSRISATGLDTEWLLYLDPAPRSDQELDIHELPFIELLLCVWPCVGHSTNLSQSSLQEWGHYPIVERRQVTFPHPLGSK